MVEEGEVYIGVPIRRYQVSVCVITSSGLCSVVKLLGAYVPTINP